MRNRHGLFGLGTVKSAVYFKNELMKSADFLCADTNLGKLIVTLIIIGWAQSKMGETL